MVDTPTKWSKTIGELAYLAESIEFKSLEALWINIQLRAGVYSTLNQNPAYPYRQLIAQLGHFVLGDSCESKETIDILENCKNIRLKIFDKIKSHDPNFNLHKIRYQNDLSYLDEQEKKLLSATLKNRDLLEQGFKELKKEEINHEYLGELLNQEHTNFKGRTQY